MPAGEYSVYKIASFNMNFIQYEDSKRTEDIEEHN